MEGNHAKPGSFLIGNNLEVLLIDSQQIKSVIGMETAIILMEKAFKDVSEKKCHVPLRSIVENPGKTITLFFKPAFNDTLGRFAVKFLTQNEENNDRGMPTIMGIIMLMDADSGRILSVMDGTYITGLRTGAAGGLAARILSREDSESFALFGCGVQGRTQLEAVLTVRDIKIVYLFDRSEAAVKEFIEEMQPGTKAKLIAAHDLNILKEVDIIATATGSAKPLFSLKNIKPGVHITAVGAYKPHMQELDTDIIKNSSLFVDDKEACIKEAGDIVIPLDRGIISPDHIRSELGDVISGKFTGRSNEDEITVFKSVGVAIQDLVVANAVYEKYTRTEAE